MLVFKSQSTTRFTMKNDSPIFSLFRYLFPRKLSFAVHLHLTDTLLWIIQFKTTSSLTSSDRTQDVALSHLCPLLLWPSLLLLPNAFSVPLLSFLTLRTSVCSINFLMCLVSLSDCAIFIFAYPMCKSVLAPLWELKLLN